MFLLAGLVQNPVFVVDGLLRRDQDTGWSYVPQNSFELQTRLDKTTLNT